MALLDAKDAPQQLFTAIPADNAAHELHAAVHEHDGGDDGAASLQDHRIDRLGDRRVLQCYFRLQAKIATRRQGDCQFDEIDIANQSLQGGYPIPSPIPCFLRPFVFSISPPFPLLFRIEDFNG